MANPQSVFGWVYFLFLSLVLSGATFHLCECRGETEGRTVGKLVCFLCWSCSPKPTYHPLSWYEVQQRQALPFLVYRSLKRGELCSLFSRLPARFSWCFWIRWKRTRTGTSSAAALLAQHALLTHLTLGNGLTFLSDHTYNKPLRQLWSESLRAMLQQKQVLWKHVWKQRVMCHQAELLTMHVSKGAVRTARRQLRWLNITTWTSHAAIALVKGH